MSKRPKISDEAIGLYRVILQFFQPKKISDSHFRMLPDEMGPGSLDSLVAVGCGVRAEQAITK